MVMDNIDAYKEILSVLEKYKQLISNDPPIDITSNIINRIRLEEISKDFHIKLNVTTNPNWCKISDYETIGMYGKDHNRTVSWSNDGSQPENERLYQISFPTGAYIFGGSHPKNTFRDFFNELKSYKPKYLDTANHCLYFTSANAMRVHGDFKEIFDKYRRKVTKEVKEQKIKELEKALEKLKGVST